MFKKIHRANRGEIAVRLIRACREMGIQTVAIYSDVDRDALHVRFADEAYHCGPPPARESYLVYDKVLEIARKAGADGIHPGYGFLAENGDFADACEAAGIKFVGPAGDVMRKMGDKVTARQTMEAAGVPIVPGTTEALSDDEAIAFSKKIGLPVMVKASAGGGGKGMRFVNEEKDLPKAIARARGEAKASFGDDSLYVEKFVEEPRHIEIQVLADTKGNTIHLGERECSIQRRHQKVVEEAPAPRMSEELRGRMGAAAVAATKAMGYRSAGSALASSSGPFTRRSPAPAARRRAPSPTTACTSRSGSSTRATSRSRCSPTRTAASCTASSASARSSAATRRWWRRPRARL